MGDELKDVAEGAANVASFGTYNAGKKKVQDLTHISDMPTGTDPDLNIPPPIALPLPKDTKAAKRRAAAGIKKRGGRQSTILTAADGGGDELLGG